MERKGIQVQEPCLWSPSRIAIQRAAKRRSRYYAFLNLWPFVGVLIVLLCIFMTETRPHQHVWWFPVDLPVAPHSVSQPHAIREDSIRISIMRDGQIYFRSSLVRPRDLSGVIRSAVKDGAENKVYLAVDSRTLYRDVNVVVNQIRLAGLSDICFIAAHRTPNLESR
jgi:biopolymer transport protein ExbD